MSLLCNCPESAAIPNVPISDCPVAFGQTQKAILQRVFSTGTTKNTIADPTLLASWAPLLAAADGTKVVQTPYLTAPETEPGAARTFGGGNATLGGIEITIGREPTPFTGTILRNPQDTIKALKNYQCENVGVWLVDEYGRIGCLVDDHDTPTTYYPIPVSGFFVGDKDLGGLEEADLNAIMWKFFPNWSDQFVIVTPADFNALTDLVTPTS
jgi:hypothetical protein